MNKCALSMLVLFRAAIDILVGESAGGLCIPKAAGVIATMSLIGEGPIRKGDV
jgi:hypothetical protein